MRLYTKITRRASVLCLVAVSITLLGAKGCDNPNGQGVTDTGTVTGRLIDASTHQPIQQAIVWIGELPPVRIGPAQQGGFVIADVPIGTQTVNVQAIGYQPPPLIQVIVRKGKTSDIGGGDPYALVPTGAAGTTPGASGT